MHKKMNIWWLIAVVGVLLTAFFWCSRELSTTIAELQDVIEQSTVRLTELQARNAELEAVLKTVGTDAFIEKIARSEQDYMMPDEIRFIITSSDEAYAYVPEPTEVPSP